MSLHAFQEKYNQLNIPDIHLVHFPPSPRLQYCFSRHSHGNQYHDMPFGKANSNRRFSCCAWVLTSLLVSGSSLDDSSTQGLLLISDMMLVETRIGCYCGRRPGLLAEVTEKQADHNVGVLHPDIYLVIPEVKIELSGRLFP